MGVGRVVSGEGGEGGRGLCASPDAGSFLWL